MMLLASLLQSITTLISYLHIHSAVRIVMARDGVMAAMVRSLAPLYLIIKGNLTCKSKTLRKIYLIAP